MTHICGSDRTAHATNLHVNITTPVAEPVAVQLEDSSADHGTAIWLERTNYARVCDRRASEALEQVFCRAAELSAGAPSSRSLHAHTLVHKAGHSWALPQLSHLAPTASDDQKWLRAGMPIPKHLKTTFL